MDAFYRNTTDYTAFQEPAVKTREWLAMDSAVDCLLAQKGRIRILELGAGRSAYHRHLGERRPAVELHAQDITPANEAYLRSCADVVHIGDIAAIEGSFDVIFSTYVLEHVCDPERFLEQVDRLTAPGGWHFVFCPRYDNLIYTCPSLRHRGIVERYIANVRMGIFRIAYALTGTPCFCINSDPAVLHRPWRRDADAVHLVSRPAINSWHRRRGYAVILLPQRSSGFRDWILVNQLLLSAGYQKTRAESPCGLP